MLLQIVSGTALLSSLGGEEREKTSAISGVVQAAVSPVRWRLHESVGWGSRGLSGPMGLASFPFGHFLLEGVGQVEDFAIAAHDAAPVAEIAGAAGEELYHLAAKAGAAGGRRVADGVGDALGGDVRQAVL